MEVTEAAVEMLKAIRDEMRRGNERLDARLGELRTELRATNERLDALASRLDARDEISALARRVEDLERRAR